jgi:hypothetical protein
VTEINYKTRDHSPEQRQINSLKLRFPQTI